MATVHLKNTNPLGDVYVAALGRVVEAGEVFEVDSKVAGKAPGEFKRVSRDRDTGELHKHDRAVSREVVDGDGVVQHVETYDPGHGLLAQVGNFEQVEAPKKDDDQQDKSKAGQQTDTNKGEPR